MRLLVPLLLLLAAVAALPSVDAHSCNGGYNACGDCVKGENHNHNDAKGQCSSGPGYYSSNGYGGQRADIPAPGFAFAVGAMAFVALLWARRA